MIRNWLTCTGIVLAGSLSAQVALRIDSLSLRLGDQFTATLEVSVPPGAAWINRQAIWPDSMKSFAIVRAPDPGPAEGMLQDHYVLAVFDTGTVVVPALPVILQGSSGTDTFYTGPVTLSVASVEPEGGLQPIRDIRREPFRPAYYLKYLPILLVLSGLAFLVVRWYRRNRTEAAAPPAPGRSISAEDWAEEQLSALQARQLWQHGDVKGHYTGLTDVFRGYLERRYHIHALEQTTGEISTQLRALHLPAGVIGDATSLLEIADFVKFAKADPGMVVHEQAIGRVRQFIENARPRPAAQPDTHA